MLNNDVPAPSTRLNEPRTWTDDEIRTLVIEKFGKRPCLYQIEVAKAIYAGRDVISCPPTGAGKTLSFWIALLMAQSDNLDRCCIVVTPLNVLGKQNVDILKEVGITAISVTAENASATTFEAISQGKYQVIVTNPEIFMTSDDVQGLWKKTSFIKRVLMIIFDEGHCISQWEFRKHYLTVGRLRHFIQAPIPFYVTSATLPPPIIAETRRLLYLRHAETSSILCSNDRPDIHLTVRQLVYPASSYKDLGFLIPSDLREGMDQPPKFLVFFDNTKETEAAVKFLRSKLPSRYHSKITYFHSTMSQQYRESTVKKLRRSEIWGICCTDAFGMGMDIPDIARIIQFKVTCDFNTYWQRLGRAAQQLGTEAVAMLFVEKKDMRGGTEKYKPAENSLENQEEDTDSDVTFDDFPDSPMDNSPDNIEVSALTGAHKNPNNTTTPNSELEKWRVERRRHYARPEILPNEFEEAKKGKVPGSAMDDFINPPSFVHCRREVPKLYFANDKRVRNSHYLCDPGVTDGCKRCRPHVSSVCCDLCHPHAFLKYHVPLIKAKSQHRYEVKPYLRTDQHKDLEQALYAWRQQQALEHLGPAVVRTHGAKYLLPESDISRIIDCATAGKITTLMELRNETEWAREWIELCGESLISLVLSHFPLTNPTAEPSHPHEREPAM